jgi:UDP-N-acetylglucosamine 2-epimerase (non-hydrolysing)
MEEGVPEERITVTGNTVIDALHWVVEKIKNDQVLSFQLKENLVNAGYDTRRLEISGGPSTSSGTARNNEMAGQTGHDERRLVLITGHRRENFGEGFINICKAIRDLARKYPEVDFVYPMHLNPNVRKPIMEFFGEQISPRAALGRNDNGGNLFFIEPLDYLDFVYLMEKSYLVLTDSGGIQEEAPGLGKPVLVMRDTTERPEALDAGTVRLVGTDYEQIVTEVSALLDDTVQYGKMSHAVNPYGDGKACPRIVAKFK